VIIVDEVDGFLSMDRMRTFHVGNLNAGSSNEEVTTYCVDMLDLICRYKFVIGYCAFVDENLIRTLKAKLEAIRNAGGEAPKKIYQFNFGCIRADGQETMLEPNFHTRTGNSKEEFRSDTLNQLVRVLSGPAAPKCVFVVHAFKDQIDKMADEVEANPAKYHTGGRQVMKLVDTESTDAAQRFFDKHRAHIQNEKGWIFFSHRGVARGLDLNGPEAATMIINFRFANTTELTQTIGRGNRNPRLHGRIVSHVFIDSQATPSISKMREADL
jgi:hypothetical protein